MIGGFGPESTLDYYRLIIINCVLTRKKFSSLTFKESKPIFVVKSQNENYLEEIGTTETKFLLKS